MSREQAYGSVSERGAERIINKDRVHNNRRCLMVRAGEMIRRCIRSDIF